MAKEQQDVDTLKRRGRRRLVGAVALVLLAVIVLPMVFDPQPRQNAPAVSVRIPGEDEGPFKPKPAPRLAEKKAEEKKAEEKKVEEKPVAEPKATESKPPAKPAAKAPATPADGERARAETALANAEFVIPVGAFANPQPVIAKLKEARLRYYTESIATTGGPVTRVRAGPFASRAEADKALETLKGLGLKPGNVSSKS